MTELYIPATADEADRAAFSHRISENLQAARWAKGWSQRRLAREIGCPRTTITRWETKGYIPSAFYLERIADAYRISIDDLFTRTRREN